jgi:hypothetical protein
VPGSTRNSSTTTPAKSAKVPPALPCWSLTWPPRRPRATSNERSRPSGALWVRLVNGWSERLRDRLSDLPSAAIPTDISALDGSTFEVARVLEQWLEYIGFTVEDLDDGIYFDVLRHDF